MFAVDRRAGHAYENVDPK